MTYFQTLTGALGSALAYITGSQVPGQVLTAVLVPSAGTASSWQWTLNGTNISGQTASTYTVLSTDPGSLIGVKINGGAFTASVSIPAIPPVFSAAPTISAASTTGVTFTAATLSSAGTPTSTVTHDLYDNGALVASNYVSGGTFTVGHTMTLIPYAVQGGVRVLTGATSAGFVVTSAGALVPLVTAITRPVANRTKQTYINTHLSDGVNKFGVYRSRHRVFPGWDCSGGVRFWFPNRSSEADGANAITVAAEYEYPAGSNVWTSMTFGGQASITIAANALDQGCDAIALNMTGGTYLRCRTHVSVTTAGQTWPMMDSISLAAANTEGYALSTTGDPGDPPNADVTEFYGPTAITGLSKSPYVAGIFSDSIGNGARDTLTGDKIGFLQRILADTIPVINFSTSGETLAAFVGTNTKRFALADQMGLTHGVLAYGTNDAKTLTTLKANYATALGLLQVRNLMVTACPAIARTTSTNNWTAAGDQTPVTDYGVAGTIDQFNTFIQGMVGGSVDTFLDTRTGWQDASDLILTTGSAFGYTPDGLHPGPFGNAQIASGRAPTDAITYATKTFSPSYAAWATTAGFFDAPNDTAAGAGVITTANNKVSGKGNITQGASVTATTSRGPIPLFNAPAYVQTRSGTSDTSVLIASATDPISTMMQGTNIDYTVLMAFEQTTAGVSFPFGWSEPIDATNTRQACLVIRNGSTASWRYGTTGDANLDVNFTYNIVAGKMFVVAVRHVAGKTDVWINSLTKQVSAATQAPAAAFGTGTRFSIGAAQLAGSSPAFNTNGFAGATFAFVAQPGARSDPEINAGITELARRFGVILT